MKKLFPILLLCLMGLSPKRKASVYTWDSTNTNINITNSTFGTPLVAGDLVHIPSRAGGTGYRSFSFSGLNSGAAGAYITIQFDAGSYIQPSSSSLQANTMDNSNGVHIIKMRMDDHVDAAMRLGGTGYSSWIWWDSCHFQGMPGFGPVANGSLPAFAGDTTKMFHHWKFTNILFDSVYTGTSGGIALALGGNAAGTIVNNACWRDVLIDSCTFWDYSSASPNTSSYIRLLSVINAKINHSRTRWLGVVFNPTGHAAAILTLASKYEISNNYFGPYNFGNEVRDLGSCDLPGAGPNYTGRSSFYNNIIVDKRKYPVLETRPVDGGTLSTLSPYFRSRTMAYVYNCTAMNLAVGTGNGPYETNMVDCYANDTVFVKNCIIVGVRDTSWATVYGPFMWSAANGAITTIDTASNRLVQLWNNSGLKDSISFTPIQGGLLNGYGVSVPSFITTDYYGNQRTTAGLVDIGAVQFVPNSQCNCATGNRPFKTHP